MLYIHYWYADYEANAGAAGQMYNALAVAKARAGFFGKNGLGMQHFQKRVGQMNLGASDEEFDRIIDFLSGNGELRKEVFDSQTSSNVSAKSMATQAIGSVTVESINAKAEEMAEIIDSFQCQLEETINELYGKSVEPSVWQSFVQETIEQYAATKGVTAGSSKMRQAILNDFLQHQGLVKLGLTANLGTGQSTLETSLRNMVLLAEALPEYGSQGSQTLSGKNYSTSKGNRRTKNGLDTLYVIAGKLQGLFNNVVGTAGEIAWAVAEESAKEQLGEALDQANISIKATPIGGTTVTVTEHGEKIGQKDKAIKNVSKPDVKVQIIKNGKVIVEYGTSVKTYTFNSTSGAKNVSLVSGTSFLQAADKAFGNQGGRRYMLNLAAGHPGKGTSGGVNYSAGDLNQKWDTLVEYIVIQNFLDVLLGVLTKEGPNNLYLVVNGQIVTVPEILAKIGDGSMNFGSRLYMNTNSGTRSLTRASLMKLNQWKWMSNSRTRIQDAKNFLEEQPLDFIGPKQNAALSRSATAASAIIERLQAQKLEVTLKQLEAIIG